MLLAPTLTLSAGSGAAIVRPTFSRDFAGEKTLDNGTGPAITFTRASDATFFDANGTLQTAGNNVPRFDHDPASGNSLGLLIEEARTNLLVRSEELNNTWGLTNATVASNAAASPSGATSADLIYPSADGITANTQQTPTVSANTTYTFSAFLKASGKTQAMLQVNTPISPGRAFFITFNLSNGTAGTVQNLVGTTTGTAIAITSVGNGWYRASVTVVTDSTTAEARVFVGPCDAADSRAVTASGTDGILVWGAQLELGAFPTSYIPTTTAAATRSADSAVVTPIASFYNQAEGTLFAEFSKFQMITNSKVAIFNHPSNNLRYLGFENAGSGTPTTNRFIVNNDGGGQAIITFASAVVGTVYRNIGAYKLDDFHAAQNGTLGTPDVSGTPPEGLTRLGIGTLPPSAGFPLNGYIRKFAYYPKRLTNTLLQQLTT